jgi:EAL domain-containing protein (putative c-di-GMP-specific phosphodiesterase class I)
VIDQALSQMSQWQQHGLTLAVSVNVGALQLQQGRFVDRLSQQLAAHPDVLANNLELEILETSALEDIADIAELMNQCLTLGVHFAVDDFGTGYSSLTYLKRLPAGLLKIDQSFVRDMLEDPDDLAIVKGVIGLARAFHRKVIAEGVETIAHGQLLLAQGCQLAQGYGIARPMPANDIPQWVTQWRPDKLWQINP